MKTYHLTNQRYFCTIKECVNFIEKFSTISSSKLIFSKKTDFVKKENGFIEIAGRSESRNAQKFCQKRLLTWICELSKTYAQQGLQPFVAFHLPETAK